MSDATVRAVMQDAERAGQAAGRPVFRSLNRREFLGMTGLGLAGLTLAYGFQPIAARAAAATEFRPNGFVHIGTDGTITLYAKASEVGQGIKTSFPMIVAEELDADWASVRVEQAPVDEATYGRQFAGGSMNTPLGWEQHRQAGAMARALLVSAAAERWGVTASECHTAAGFVYCGERRAAYAELAEAAAKLPLPDVTELRLKERSEWTLLGRRIPGVDNEAIVTGQPLFGIDARIPGMRYATYTKCPARGGRVRSANLEAIRALPGVLDAFVLEGNSGQLPDEGVMACQPGVAIVARSTWSAMQARQQLQVDWDESDAARDSSSAAERQARELAGRGGAQLLFESGDIEAGLRDGAHRLDAFYSYPFVSHATLEPQNCTAWVRDGIAELWAPSQTPQRLLNDVAVTLGIDPSKVIVHQLRAGGGFGRRLLNDFGVEAAVISQRAGVPVKLQWTREDDMQHDYLRVAGYHALQGAVDASGRLSAWRDHFITFSADGESPVSGGNMRGNYIAEHLVPNAQVSQTLLPLKTPCGPWRAPGECALAFAFQSFVHELSHAAGRDHVEFLVEMLGEPRWLGEQGIRDLNTGRAASVIRLAADKAGWGKPLPRGRALGLAWAFSHAGHVAEVADLSVDENRKITLHGVTVVADVGPVINRSAAENQLQGSVIDGLSTMMNLEVTLENGRVQQRNFDRYPILRVGHSPRVDVHFIESDYAPTGLGEPGIPAVAPAVGNAIFAACGHRVRELPLSREGFSFA